MVVKRSTKSIARRRRLRVGGDIVFVGAAMVLDLLIWGGNGHTRLGFTVPAWVVVGSAVVAFSFLIVRRQHPWAAFVSLWIYSLMWGALLPTYSPFTGLLVVLYNFARRSELRVARRALVPLIVPWAINTYDAVVATGVKLSSVVVTAAIWCAIAATVWLAGRAAYRTQRIFELQTAKQAAEASLALQEQQLRLARELHDIVAHSLSAVMFQAAGARAAASTLDPQTDGALQAIETSATQATRELRRLLGLLHPEADATMVEAVASLHDLDQLLDTTRSCAVDVRFSEEGQRTRLDPSVDHTAYRVLQECLSNAMKHGGEGTEADVHLAWYSTTLRITVRTRNGRGPGRAVSASSQSGHGLNGLRQRMVGIGGRLDASRTPEGFLVIADLPLEGHPRRTT